MVPGYSTDASSLALNSAIFCRIAVILVLNVDLLVLPTEANGMRTTQTRFYCQFGKKARLLVPLQNGHDYYLFAMPILLLLIVIALYFNFLSRAKALFARYSHDERAATFRFGRSTVPWHEDRGRELLRELEERQLLWAAATLTRTLTLHRQAELQAGGQEGGQGGGVGGLHPSSSPAVQDSPPPEAQLTTPPPPLPSLPLPMRAGDGGADLTPASGDRGGLGSGSGGGCGSGRLVSSSGSCLGSRIPLCRRRVPVVG
jgi:hypothetical protein